MDLLKFSNLSKSSRIKHFVSTRKGGASEAPFDELNLSLHVGDDAESVLSNRRLLAKAVRLKPSELVYLKQAHSCRIKTVMTKHRGRGAKKFSQAIGGFDAMITDSPGTCLIVLVADCVPILLFDPSKHVIGAVHAGWKGTMKEITKKTVDKMKREFGCDPEDIIAGIGPSIGPCCFEVKKNVFHLANIIYSAGEEVVIQQRNKTFVDLWQANKLQLMRAGVLEGNVEISNICTVCGGGRFYSARASGVTGRFVAGIILKK
jgi:YfiH family protein